MLVLPLAKGGFVHNVLEAISDLSDVAHVEFINEGFILQAVETNRASIVALFHPADDFPGYFCDEYISMGILIDELVKAIRCGDEKDNITLKVVEENFDNITLSFVSPEDTIDYYMRVTDAEIASFKLPDSEDLKSYYKATVKMSSVEFSGICKYLSNSGEGDGVISVTEKGLTFFADGTGGVMCKEYSQVEEGTTTFEINMQEPITLTLDLKYFNTFAKVFTMSGQVKLSLSKTHPLLVECQVGEKENGSIRYFVAPKMEGEEEKEGQGQKDIDASTDD